MKEQIRDTEGKNVKSNIHLKGVPEGKNKENVRKEIIEKIIAKNPPDMNPQRNIMSQMIHMKVNAHLDMSS